MLIGIVLMGYFAWLLTRERQPPLFDTRVEVLGLYWHFVDVVWLGLFLFVYVL